MADAPAPAKAPRPAKHRVRLHNPDNYSGDANRTIVSFEGDTGEVQARNYIKQHHPRGREVFYDGPAGKEHYSADLDAQGSDPWTAYGEDED